MPRKLRPITWETSTFMGAFMRCPNGHNKVVLRGERKGGKKTLHARCMDCEKEFDVSA
jgi:hypothetical protein